MELKRRCAWVPDALLTPVRPVWVRRQVHTEVCPKSIVKAASLAWIEEYAVWRRLGRVADSSMSARQVDAFLVLDGELRAEHHDAKEQKTRRSGGFGGMRADD